MRKFSVRKIEFPGAGAQGAKMGATQEKLYTCAIIIFQVNLQGQLGGGYINSCF